MHTCILSQFWNRGSERNFTELKIRMFAKLYSLQYVELPFKGVFLALAGDLQFPRPAKQPFYL